MTVILDFVDESLLKVISKEADDADKSEGLDFAENLRNSYESTDKGEGESDITDTPKKALVDGNSTLFGTGWGYTLDEFGDKLVTGLEDKAIDFVTGGIVKAVLGF